MNFQVTLTGRSPLLMHHNNIGFRDAQRLRGHDKSTPAGDDRYPGDRWKSYLYVDDEQIVIPVENLLAALLHAGKSITVGRLKTLKTASQQISFDDFNMPLLVDGKTIKVSDLNAIDGDFNEQAEQAKKLGIELFVKPVRVGTASHVRARPRFNKWQVRTTFSVDDPEMLMGDRLERMWFEAGRKAGLCDWRPSSKTPGMYGMFNAELKKLG